MKALRGRAHRLGTNVDTDVIIPARYLTSTDPEELGHHLMEAADPEFSARVTKGDVIVAETNFGSGSSREHAPLAILGAGISCVVASSFARIFFRNAFNVGLPVVECPEIVEVTEDGDEVEVDLAAGVVRNLTKNQEARFQELPQFMRELLEAGGLIPYLRNRVGAGGDGSHLAAASGPKEADFLHD